MIPFELVVLVGDDSSTLTKLFGLGVAGLWLGTVLISNRIRRPRPAHLVILLFVLWNGLSILWTIDVDNTLERVTTYLQLIGLIYILWDLYHTQSRIAAALQVYVLGCYVSIWSTLHNYFIGAEVDTGGDLYSRYGATNFDPNDLSLILAIGVPFAWHLATSAKDALQLKLLKLLNYAYVPACLVTILLTGSRGGLISVSIALLYILTTISRRKLISRLGVCCVLLIAFLLLLPLVPEKTMKRIYDGTVEVKTGSLDGRSQSHF